MLRSFCFFALLMAFALRIQAEGVWTKSRLETEQKWVMQSLDIEMRMQVNEIDADVMQARNFLEKPHKFEQMGNQVLARFFERKYKWLESACMAKQRWIALVPADLSDPSWLFKRCKIWDEYVEIGRKRWEDLQSDLLAGGPFKRYIEDLESAAAGQKHIEDYLKEQKSLENPQKLDPGTAPEAKGPKEPRKVLELGKQNPIPVEKETKLEITKIKKETPEKAPERVEKQPAKVEKQPAKVEKQPAKVEKAADPQKIEPKKQTAEGDTARGAQEPKTKQEDKEREFIEKEIKEAQKYIRSYQERLDKIKRALGDLSQFNSSIDKGVFPEEKKVLSFKAPSFIEKDAKEMQKFLESLD